ncbi:hypothetical protein NFI96_028185 [Prochilodus magdalenae]|nr:hypothetical protein NFI96_028185 [Prochilodus magdalenae]
MAQKDQILADLRLENEHCKIEILDLRQENEILKSQNRTLRLENGKFCKEIEYLRSQLQDSKNELPSPKERSDLQESLNELSSPKEKMRKAVDDKLDNSEEHRESEPPTVPDKQAIRKRSVKLPFHLNLVEHDLQQPQQTKANGSNNSRKQPEDVKVQVSIFIN